MILKSYIVENDINTIKSNVALIYGENLGLLQDLKNAIKKTNKTQQLLVYTQDDVLKNENSFYNEIKGISLFEQKKVFIIENVTDKLINVINDIVNNNSYKFYLFSDLLEKKSKLRNFFEKNKILDIVPCYNDNLQSLKSIITNKLKDFSGLTPEIINVIVNSSSGYRSKLNNEIEKIKIYFDKKIIKHKDLIDLLNLRDDDDFNFIKDSALSGNKVLTNKLLSSTNINFEKSTLYLAMIYKRFERISEILNKNTQPETAIEQIKPQIFWKEKPIIIQQTKVWSKDKILKAMSLTYNTEIKIKSYSFINKNIVIKKLLEDICNLANAA